ncbi:SRPBCC family protein [Nocardia cerradoensis]|uniref:SRPBCC family protein n=1 Tax=Nocardia cerradoensis TaxID=85688 RepID=UPI0002D7F3F8|nr:SRPBCC family protein [Nocardia cerradoensis]NKY44920.1 SRPBCC family protein [Nocardia cerradoensis]
MATIRHEIAIDAPPQHIWDVLRDIGAVHERLLPGRVADTTLDGEHRILTFPDGHRIRERIVSVDDDLRRLAYSVIEGARPALTHHHASFEVRETDSRTGRLIWTTDLLPDERASEVRIRIEYGAAEMKRAIEAAAVRGASPGAAGVSGTV